MKTRPETIQRVAWFMTVKDGPGEQNISVHVLGAVPEGTKTEDVELPTELQGRAGEVRITRIFELGQVLVELGLLDCTVTCEACGSGHIECADCGCTSFQRAAPAH